MIYNTDASSSSWSDVVTVAGYHYESQTVWSKSSVGCGACLSSWSEAYRRTVTTDADNEEALPDLSVIAQSGGGAVHPSDPGLSFFRENGEVIHTRHTRTTSQGTEVLQDDTTTTDASKVTLLKLVIGEGAVLNDPPMQAWIDPTTLIYYTWDSYFRKAYEYQHGLQFNHVCNVYWDHAYYLMFHHSLGGLGYPEEQPNGPRDPQTGELYDEWITDNPGKIYTPQDRVAVENVRL